MKKTQLCPVVVLGLTLLAIALPAPLRLAAQPAAAQRKASEEPKVTNGPDVEHRLSELKRSNPNVRAAISAFEQRGLKAEKPVAIFSKIPSPETRFTKVSYAPQQTISEDGVEIIFMGFVSLWDEWQGSTIATFYGPNGAIDEQYVADIVITRDPYNRADWQCRFEVKFEDGVGYLRTQPGMFTGFRLGIPIEQQPVTPALNLLPSQFPDSSTRAAYYELFPEQVNYDRLGSGGGEYSGGRGIIRNIGYAIPQRDPDLAWRPNTGGKGATIVGWKGAVSSAAGFCGWGSVGCAVGSLFAAESTFGVCAAGACITGVVRGAVTNLRFKPK
jgi:hypothetical protein